MLVGIDRYRGKYWPIIAIGVLLLVGCPSNDSSTPPPKPNILLILTDDLGNNDIASWGDGNAPTPHIDQLSQESVRFRQHYTDSTCSPSRASLLTGKRAIEIGFQPTGLGLSQDLPNLPKSLKKLGYRTFHIGKWHVGEALEYPEIQPGKLGFDYWWGALNHFVLRGPGPNGEIVRGPPTHIDPWLQENGKPPKQYKGYLDDLLVDKAIALINESGGQPWFINLWLHSPHTPYQPSPEFKAQFPDNRDGHYLAVLKQLDHNIARLLEALDKRGMASDTIVVFASDNGGAFEARNFPLLGHKATYLEGGVRTPLLIRWPGHLAAEDYRDITDISDLYPTLIGLIGDTIPAGLSGVDISPALLGAPPPVRHALYWAADYGLQGMSYGGALFDEGRAYYHVLGNTTTHATTPAIGLPRPDSIPAAVDPQAANDSITEWERNARQVPVNWSMASDEKPAQLTGLDFQRAPVFGGYSLGLELQKPLSQDGVQTLIHQQNIWSLSLDAGQQLRLRFGNVELLSNRTTLNEGCNTLVASFDVQPANTYPFPRTASSRAILYLNGVPVLDSTELLSRPDSAADLSNPTYIGARHDNSGAYQGQIGRPIIVNKLLLTEQEGYRLQDMLDTLCSSKLTSNPST